MIRARHTLALSMGLVLVALVALVAPVSAQPTPTETAEATARKQFEQGEAYFKAGAFDLAAAAYQAAYDAVPEPVLLFDVGLAWENHGDAAAAIASYDRYLAVAPDGVKATEARARRDVLARRQEDERVAAERAEQERAAAERAEQERAAAELHPVQAPTPSRPSLVPALVSYGVGAVALGVAVIYGLSARSTSDDLEHDLASGPPVDTSDPRFSDGHRAALIADISFGVAGAATLVGAYFTYRVLRHRSAVTVTPAVGDDHVGATVGVRW